MVPSTRHRCTVYAVYCTYCTVRTSHSVTVDLDVLQQLNDVQRSGADARRKQCLRRLHVMRVKMIGSVGVVRT